MPLRFITKLLSDNPEIGISAGFGSGVVFSVQQLVTDENVLKIVAGIGIFLGALVAFLTVILKFIELLQKLKILEMLQKIRNKTFRKK